MSVRGIWERRKVIAAGAALVGGLAVLFALTPWELAAAVVVAWLGGIVVIVKCMQRFALPYRPVQACENGPHPQAEAVPQRRLPAKEARSAYRSA